MMSRDEAEALAKFIHSLRPDWGEQGIVHALGQARGMATPATVAIAAIRAADTPSNRTPGVIPLPGPHWPVTGTTRRRPPTRNETCGTCYLSQDECRRRWHWDHEFESVAEAKARVIATADRIPKRRKVEWIDGRPVQEVDLP